MSRIYFHSPSRDAEVRGTERAWFGNLVDRMGVGFLNIRWNADMLLSAFPADHYVHTSNNKQQALELALGALSDTDLHIGGQTYEMFSVFLNTCMTLGNDALRFAAIVHGTCEIHGWVDGPNRAWLAGIIESAPEQVIRPDAGWDSVVTLLRSRDDEPVVMSYSVGESFPNAYDSDWMPAWPEGIPEDHRMLTEAQQAEREERSEAWYELPTSEQWERGLRWLRGQPGGLEMTPERWGQRTFRHGIDALQLIELLRAQQPARL